MDDLKGLLVFYLGDLAFCADIRDITTTIKVDKLGSGYPASNIDNLKLMINKSEVQIINLHQIFNITLSKFDSDTRIFLYEKEDIRFGFFVDSVSELITIDRKITRFMEFLPPENNEFLLSIIKFEGKQLYLPDFEKIIRKKVLRKPV